MIQIILDLMIIKLLEGLRSLLAESEPDIEVSDLSFGRRIRQLLLKKKHHLTDMVVMDIKCPVWMVSTLPGILSENIF